MQPQWKENLWGCYCKEGIMSTKAMTISAAILVFLLALGLTLYPLIFNQYNQQHQSQIHTAYQEQVEQMEDEDILVARTMAVAYNEVLKPGVQDRDAYSRDALLVAAQDYDNQLDITGSGIMGYVDIPKISVTLPIYHGTDSNTLSAGIGHLLGSSLPIGGGSTHTILTAHSGMASQKMFSDLDQLGEGDVFYLEVLDEILAYQVDAIHTVLSHDTTYLGITTGEDYCTLVTCTPFGVNTHRLLVHGSRIPYEEAEEIVSSVSSEEGAASTWEEKYVNGILTGLCIVGVISIIAVGKYGLMRRRFLMQSWSVTYTNLLTTGQLHSHLMEIEETARSRVEQIVSQMAKAAGVTEEVKATDQMKWVGLMNNFRSAAEEQIMQELIYA